MHRKLSHCSCHLPIYFCQVIDSRDAEGDTGGEVGGGRAGEAGGGRGGEAGGDVGGESGGSRVRLKE